MVVSPPPPSWQMADSPTNNTDHESRPCDGQMIVADVMTYGYALSISSHQLAENDLHHWLTVGLNILYSKEKDWVWHKA